MAERIAKIATAQETLDNFFREAQENLFFSRYIEDRDSRLVADALIEAGFMSQDDGLRVTYEVDPLTEPDAKVRSVKIYTARRTPEGKLVPTSFLGKFELDIDYDNDN
jgi:hypothetical protein